MKTCKSVCKQLKTGTLSFDFKMSSCGTLLKIQGKKGCISVDCPRSCLQISIQSPKRQAKIDIEDVIVQDDRWHSFALLVTDFNTKVYVDGNLEMASTSQVFTKDIEACDIDAADEDYLCVANLCVTDKIMSAQEIMASSTLPAPYIEFAANYLDTPDAKSLINLSYGSLYIRFRTRGKGQCGTIFAAGDDEEQKLLISIDERGISYQVKQEQVGWRKWFAQGGWDDGSWHDLVLRVGAGAVDIFVDAIMVEHLAGQAFFADTSRLNCAYIGQDIHGDRLFGEVGTARIYKESLTLGNILKLSYKLPYDTQAIFDRGMEGCVSYRIPSIIRCESGVLVAGADQRVSIPNDAPNQINFVIRRSKDQGQTWEDMQTVLSSTGKGLQGESVIDSCMVYDKTLKRIIVLIDHFPGGIGQFNADFGTGYTDDGCIKLHDGQGRHYIGTHQGCVIDDKGCATPWKLEGKRLYYKDAEIGLIDEYEDRSHEHMLWSARVSYLYEIHSDDDGKTWSDPCELNRQLKEEWMSFLGTGPGCGIQMENSPYKGRVIIPYYASEESGRYFSAGVLYKDEAETSWHRGKTVAESLYPKGLKGLEDPGLSFYEDCVAEISSGRLILFMRNQNKSGKVGIA